MQDDTMLQMREINRQHMRWIWENSAQDGAELSDEDQVLLEMMRMHPEYYDLWGRIDEVTDQELERDGSNPILHILFHTTIANQIAAGEPPETAKTLQRLMKQGVTRHDALHQIGSVLADELFEIMKFHREFDESTYTKKLRSLGKPGKKRKSHHRRRRL